MFNIKYHKIIIIILKYLLIVLIQLNKILSIQIFIVLNSILHNKKLYYTIHTNRTKNIKKPDMLLYLNSIYIYIYV